MRSVRTIDVEEHFQLHNLEGVARRAAWNHHQSRVVENTRGGHYRLYLLWLTRWAIRHLNARGHPAVLYLHVWEPSFKPACAPPSPPGLANPA